RSWLPCNTNSTSVASLIDSTTAPFARVARCVLTLSCVRIPLLATSLLVVRRLFRTGFANPPTPLSIFDGWTVVSNMAHRSFLHIPTANSHLIHQAQTPLVPLAQASARRRGSVFI